MSETPRERVIGARLAEMPYLSGNETELLIDGEETFGSILDGIDRAREYILFQFFIVKHDELGTVNCTRRSAIYPGQILAVPTPR